MPCFRPLRAYQGPSGVSFVERSGFDHRTLDLPCGQCVGCRLDRSRAWAARCVHESQLWPHNSFLTLTYRPEALPPGGSLRYRDFQLFMKALRRARAPSPVRFFACGEYGDKLSRPHYHAIVFNVEFPDMVKWSGVAGRELFTSKELSELWPHGHALIGAVTFDSAAYVARYVMKKITGDAAGEHYRTLDPETGELVERVAEFCQMSRRPGIGQDWLRLYWSDVYPRGRVVVNGSEMKVPRYYDKIAKRLDAFEDSVQVREDFARRHAADRTDERLRVRERVQVSNLSRTKRGFESET